MNAATNLLIIATLLGSALIGGVFFAFSSFIMKALGRIPSEEGIAAMQSINIVVINRSFLGAFFGTAVSSLGTALLALRIWGTAPAYYFLAGAIFYVVGTFFVTIFGNVPLNNQLAAVDLSDSNGKAVWQHYLDRWTMLNTVRTVAAMAATLMFTLGLLRI